MPLQCCTLVILVCPGRISIQEQGLVQENVSAVVVRNDNIVVTTLDFRTTFKSFAVSVSYIDLATLIVVVCFRCICVRGLELLRPQLAIVK